MNGFRTITAAYYWFVFLASVFSRNPIQSFFRRWQSAIERTMGAVLIGLGLKIGLSGEK